MSVRIGLLLVWLASTAVLTACGSGTEASPLLVSAAASLTDAFNEIEDAFETAHPDIDVVLNISSSAALREQILEGAPADVYASANQRNMDRVVEAGEAQRSEVFARNILEIAVPRGNPAGLEGLADFANAALVLGLCAEAVPCGDLSREALANAGVTPSIDTNEPDVRALLTKVAAGELDAGVVYVTDVLAAEDDVEGITIPGDANVAAEYPIAVLRSASSQDDAESFVAFVLSDDGRAILSRHGFELP